MTERRLRVGAAKLGIAPLLDQREPENRARSATGVNGEFSARAIVVEAGGSRVALVVLDLLEFFDNVTRDVRRRVAEYTEIPPENVMISATHVHAAPRTIDHEGEIGPHTLSFDTAAFLNMVARQAAGAVVLAEGRLEPARARMGRTSVPGIGRGARVLLKDGTIAGLGSGQGILDLPPELIERERLFDDTLRLLLFENEGGDPICGLANWGCHNDLALHTSSFNTDIFGWASERIEREREKGFVLAIMAGAQGDVQPLAEIHHRTYDEKTGRMFPPGRGDDLIPPAGSILHAGLERAWQDSTPFGIHQVRASSEVSYFPWRRNPPPVPAGYIHNRKVAGGRQDERGAWAELQLVQLGDLAILGLCGEVFQEIAANLRGRSPFPHTWIASLANDRLTYLMPAWEYRIDATGRRDNNQFRYTVTDETAEEIIYASYGRLFERCRPA